MSLWTIGWLLWIAAFFVLETPAVLNSRRLDTLSEHLWWWFGFQREPRSVVDAEKLMERERKQPWHLWPRRMAAIFFFAWFVPHVFTGGWI